jgi:pyruvate/2-oxoglutarate dehydrogenase complex dihydrolipoamide acyltransferase (E2) component
LAALNAVHDEPAVEDGKVIVAKTAIVNFVVDHRYVDGGKCKNLVATFKRIFEVPEEYLRSNGRSK